jgi:hypothetical protein
MESGSRTEEDPPTQKQHCKIYVQRLQPKYLAAAMSYEGSWSGDLRGVEEHLQDGWEIVSHTFTLLEDESGLFTCILRR